ncbi:hypothetical protein AMC94_14935 [Pseudomonas amygdali pv. aesculi]|nr:hypothetical protein AL041_13005 [Pseudomonas amygdali pv. aesculi]KWT23074.1 hypothetical protein AL043_23015 [Pseudomonas amygdali pv. aesculi]KWT23283.1 hypothetical protein AL044_01260 [Pseudomonas amygdali pv. aesculi]KWT27055.1 hypothetical protein AL042_13885 [Pseudomonas amygdali pv. aesculi]KWT41125.1 hypothetical protein AMC94_14935 [Pseudomonas amygdali pv. aesculi]
MYLWSFFFFAFIFIALVIYSTAFNVLDNTDCQSYNHTKEALIYSIFRPCNALEALIYQGVTAGF